MNNKDILERDDVAAALMAAEFAAGLKYVDQQTTSLPNNQLRASRLDPKKFIGKNVKGKIPPQSYSEGEIIKPDNINELLIPLPDNIKPEMVKEKINSPENEKQTQQLELGLKVQEKQEPKNAVEWFRHLDCKLNKLEEFVTTQFRIIQGNLSIIKANTHKKPRKSRIKPDDSWKQTRDNCS